MQRVGAHLVGPAVKALEPRILGVDALERQLQTEARGKRARQRRLSSADHSRDADQHGSQGKVDVTIAKRLFASCEKSVRLDRGLTYETVSVFAAELNC